MTLPLRECPYCRDMTPHAKAGFEVSRQGCYQRYLCKACCGYWVDRPRRIYQKQIAQHLGISVNSTRYWRRMGVIPHVVRSVDELDEIRIVRWKRKGSETK